jgi:hypothetical protein
VPFRAYREGRSPKAIVEKLGRLGPQPVCGSLIICCRQALYLTNFSLARPEEVTRVAYQQVQQA